ncbi:UbiA prenyltransferase [Fimbriimonas ginsengisoli Gsoil 348]|uniref:UbiA prenyltransferase n=2 Tax=Fimbriimonas ginsengisoli TaxID=1005039 RepID=A0A068NV44_FIMGI|nr:UbiA prenyltransferase [Fimbriimonas ginsengisoli Gsoil 348]
MAPRSSGVALIKSVVKLIRPKQWAKNLLVFAALLFTAGYHHPDLILRSVAAFFAMSMLSSCTYVFNDLIDIKRDRMHPKKRFRPLASGALSKESGVALGTGLLFAGVLVAFGLGKGPIVIAIVYLGMQVLYNWRLKHTPIADVFTIAVGFVLRAVLGAAAIKVLISGWLLFCTGALALMLGFAKRRNEFILQGEDRSSSRESLVHYNRAALDAIVIMFAAGAAMCYGIYTLQSQTAHKYPALILTSIFVFYGITRYILLIFTIDEGGEPADVLFKDRHIIACVILFVISAVLAMSGLRLPILEQ